MTVEIAISGAGTDLATRCDRHVGEVFRVRCLDCDALEVAAAADTLHERLTRMRAGECLVHGGYPLPCARCARDLAEAKERGVPADV